MTDRAAQLRLGGFVAASLIAVTGLIILFGGAPRLFSNRARYVVLFSEAPGLAPGVPVRKSGVRVGEVSALDLDEQTGQVRVSLEIDRRFLPRVSEDATIFRGILSGDTSLDFVPKVKGDGQPVVNSIEAIPPDSEIVGVTPINPNQLVRQASGVLPNAQESMARILQSVERVERAVPKIERAFDEIAGLAQSGREFIPELRRTNEKVQSILAFSDPPGAPEAEQPGLKATITEIREFVKASRPLVEDLRRIVRDNEKDIAGTAKAVRGTSEAINELLNAENRKVMSDTLKNIQRASGSLSSILEVVMSVVPEFDKTVKLFNSRLAQLDPVLKSADDAFRSAAGAARNLESASKPLGENLGPVISNVNLAADQLAKTLAELRETVRVINRSDGTLQRVIADPALYNQLNDAAGNLNRTLMRAERAAADLQVFADKVARRPEIIGVGGAVRPSAGVKESPSAPIQGNPIPPSPLQPTPSGASSFRISPSSPGDLPPK